MTDLPTGTVTFLFTDIEGSTRLLQQLGSRYAEALAAHQALLRAAFSAHDGREVDTQGDSFFAAFPTAPAALAAAAQAQYTLAAHAWPVGTAVRVRIGIHTGAPVLAADRYVGLDVHRAARIAAASHGGQVLLSQATRDLGEAELPAGTRLVDLGEHRLKDLQRPEHLYQLFLPDLPSDFPPLKTLDRSRHNLPVQVTPLVGRGEAVRQVVDMLVREDVRLVTLTGPGGIGKTRLALQVAAELVDSVSDGVYVVPLGSIADADLVMSTIAQTLGLRELGSATPEENLKSYLADKDVLLVLDNFEHVVGAGPHVIELLVACPRVRALATSRLSLHLSGEHEFEVAPLGLPVQPTRRRNTQSRSGGVDADVELGKLTQYASVALFIERAQAVKRDFTVTSANAPSIAEICARLDGLPLAIELAAARVRLLPPQALLARLSSRLKLLTGGPRDLPERHQTLRNAIAWSHDLLAPEEKALFRRLSVFAGGCTLEAAETICVSPEGAPTLSLDVLDGLDSLAAQSLLRQQEASEADEPRFLMLETIREFGLEQLTASGEAEALLRAHLAYFTTLAELAAHHAHTPQEGQWHDTLEREHDNFRAVLGWTREQSNAADGLRLAGALAYFWYSRGYLSEGREWLEGMLALPQDGISGGGQSVPEQVRAVALYGAGDLALWQGDSNHAILRLEQSLALARATGLVELAVDALNRSGIALMWQGKLDLALQRWEECLALALKLGDAVRLEGPLNNLGEVAYLKGDLECAAAYYKEALGYARQAGDTHAHIMVGNLGNVARRQGNLPKAEALYRESLELVQQPGDPRAIAECLEGLVSVAASGDGVRAARLLGASQAVRDVIGAPQPPNEWADLEATLHVARAAIGDDAWAAALAAGRALTLQQAVKEALSPSSTSTSEGGEVVQS